MDAVEIMPERGSRATRQGMVKRLCVDKRVTVSIAADPASQPQEGWRAMAEFMFPERVQLWQCDEEHFLHVSASIFDLVRNDQLFAAQWAGLPE